MSDYNNYMNIYYTGIGCNETGHHTETEFLNIMRKEFTHKSWKYELEIIPREYHHQLQFKDWILPDDFTFFTLTDWIEYTGAESAYKIDRLNSDRMNENTQINLVTLNGSTSKGIVCQVS